MVKVIIVRIRAPCKIIIFNLKSQSIYNFRLVETEGIKTNLFFFEWIQK